MSVTFLTRQDLEYALTRRTVGAIFDEDADGQAEDAPINACLAYATAMCRSFLRTVNTEATLTFDADGDVPDELRFAAVDFACSYALRRKPDLVRAMGEESWTTFRDSAIDHMKRYVKTEQRLPREVSVPANVGATVSPTVDSGVRRNSPSECENFSQWGDMGDFSR